MNKTNESKLNRLQRWYQDLPDKKKYLELVTAVLSIPVMVTVLLTNTRNLKSQSISPPVSAVATTPSTLGAVTTTSSPLPAAPLPKASAAPTSPTPAPETVCKKGVGPVAIAYPQENQVVSGDPICIDISRQSSEYCSIVWSYQINGGSWSDYLDKSICMYGLSPGQKNLQLKIRSVVVNEETSLSRNFEVAGTPENPAASESAILPVE